MLSTHCDSGTCVYFGPPGGAEEYFTGLGFVRPAKKSVPDFLEELMRTPQKFYTVVPQRQLEIVLESDLTTEHKGAAESFEPSMTHTASHRDAWQIMARNYKKSPLYKNVGQTLWTDLEPVYDIKAVGPRDRRPFTASYFRQLRLVLEREFNLYRRNPAVTIVPMIRAMVLGLVVGSLFWQMGTGFRDAYSRAGLLFFLMTNNAFSSVELIPLLVSKRVVFFEQKKAGYFHGAVYYLSTFLVALPFLMLEVLIFTMIIYSMAGLRNQAGSGEYWVLYLMLLLTNLTSKAYATMMTTLAPSGVLATAVTPVFLVMFMLFSGYLNPRDSIPIGWRWMNTISFMTYAIKGLAINEFFDLPLSGPVPSGTQFLSVYSWSVDSHSERFDMLLDIFWFFLSFHAVGCLATVYLDWTNSSNEPVTDAREEAAKGWEFAEHRSKAHNPNRKENAIQMVFKDLSYSVPGKTKDAGPNVLLNRVFGFAKPGRMTALMGASGAGKTTLLDVLANKKTGGSVTGTMEFNGKPRASNFSRVAGYVEQFDSHVATATVREAIELAANLRLPESMSDDDKAKRVHEVMEQLNLESLADSIIGSHESEASPLRTARR